MADSLLELLAPKLDIDKPQISDRTTTQYLNRLPTLSLDALQTTEPQSLTQSSHSSLLSLQALSNRSHRSFVASADHLSTLSASIPQLRQEAHQLRDAVPELDEEAVRFSTKYSKTTDNAALERRKKAMQLARNVDRLSDILELPSLLSAAVSAASANSGASVASTTYSSALDLHAHIKRLQSLYPESPLVQDVASQAEDAMKEMTTNLIAGLRAPNLRLAAGMRTVGWLRRVAPDLETLRSEGGTGAGEGALGAIFLICRLAHLVSTLEALDPLRELADQETQRRTSSGDTSESWSGGQQTDRYLKRYIEIFREQSFAIISLYKNIFNPEQSDVESGVPNIRSLEISKNSNQTPRPDDPLQKLPSALATFPMHLVQLLTDTVRTYLPNVRDRSSRESLLTQLLYCAASLGRLGGDFGMILTELDEDEDIAYEWEDVMRKHRALAGRLEQLTSRVSVH
ncbi:Conserved oligomeric Golgi complex subunit 8 family protein [Penicillium ucsense]|uniref:Conserved oligomeric Golgi complex subunit 8 n=1 Tax=Penicillium ucsense TaxID=2839758 RepID=A0A8J8VYE2_9EURO|nr:Conserved oligomeric Golgi complex subunit 8 family protein [Penicillium ucsense]KAF7726446.1 Conserved oligomeric Golgi complex subunit 8 family protein [Penicillium ucsense]